MLDMHPTHAKIRDDSAKEGSYVKDSVDEGVVGLAVCERPS